MNLIELVENYAAGAVLTLLECRNKLSPNQIFRVPQILSISWSELDQVCQVFALLDEVLTLTSSGDKLALRALFYRNADLFKNQVQCDKVLNQLLRHVGVPSREICGIIPAPRGFVTGAISVNGDGKDAQNMTQYLTKCRPISSDLTVQDIIDLIPADKGKLRVLVVEKMTIFEYIRSHYDLRNLILVTGRGFPDLATRAFLRRLEALSDAPFLFLGDFDPHGYLIYLNYLGEPSSGWSSLQRSQSKNRVIGSSEQTVKRLKLVGITPEDIDNVKMILNGESLIRHALMPLSKRDRVILENLAVSLQSGSSRPSLPPSKKRRIMGTNPQDAYRTGLMTGVEFMMRHNLKCEIEALTLLPDDYFSKVYLYQKLITSSQNAK